MRPSLHLHAALAASLLITLAACSGGDDDVGEAATPGAGPSAGASQAGAAGSTSKGGSSAGGSAGQSAQGGTGASAGQPSQAGAGGEAGQSAQAGAGGEAGQSAQAGAGGEGGAAGQSAQAGAGGEAGQSAQAGAGGEGGQATQGGAGGEGGAAGQSAQAGAGGVATGKVLWTYEHALQAEFAPAIDAAGNLYLQGKDYSQTPDGAPTVVALSSQGALLWGGATAPGSVPAPAVVLAGDVVVASATSAVGVTAHRFSQAGDVLAPLEVVSDSGTISAPGYSPDGLLLVPATGVSAYKGETLQWAYTLAGDGELTGTNVAIGPTGTAYVGGRGPNARHLHAINPDGTDRWHVETGGAFIVPIAVDHDDHVHAINGDGLLTVHDDTGATLWSFEAPSKSSGGGMVIGSDGTVYFGTFNFGTDVVEALYAVKRDGSAGKQLWAVPTGEFSLLATPALSAGGTLYVGNGCRTFFAFRAADGAMLWSYDALEGEPEGSCGSGWSSATIASDGTVYASFGGGVGKTGSLFAFEGDGTGPDLAAPWPLEHADHAHTSSVKTP